MTPDELYKQIHNIILNLTSGMEMLHSHCTYLDDALKQEKARNAQLVTEKQQWDKLKEEKPSDKGKATIVQKAKN